MSDPVFLITARRAESAPPPPVSGALEPEDVSRAVTFAVSPPAHVDVNEILVRPTGQDS